MGTETLREIYQKSKTGQFADVLQLIKGVELIEEVALSILVCISNACHRDSSNIEKDEICNLLGNIISCIDTIDECQLVRYLQSIFHVIKYICDKEWFEELTKMESVIIPIFLNNFHLPHIEESKRVYQAIITKLSNTIFRLTERANTIDSNCVLELIRIILKANSQIGGIKENLSLAQKFFNIITNLKFPIDQLCEFYCTVLDCLARDLKRTKDYTDGIMLLIHIFSSLLSNIIEAKEFVVAKMFLKNIEARIRLTFVQQEFLNSHLLFHCVTAMFSSDITKINMESCIEHVKVFKTMHRKIFFNVIRFLEEPICSLLSCYKSSGCKIWCELSSDTLISLLQFVRGTICSHLVTAPTKCSCGCFLDKNYCGTLKIGCQLSGLLKYYLDSNKKVPKIVYSTIEQWLTYFYEILKIVKAHNCKKWTQMYKELGTYTYNIGTALYCQENAAFVGFYQCFLKNSLEFEGFSPELIKHSLNEVTFHTICELEDKNRNVEKCMAYAALYCLCYPQKSNPVFQSWWIKSKLKVKEDSSVQRQTLVSILQKHEKTLSSIVNPQQYLNKEKKVELLTYELLRYKAVWKSKESLMAAFSHLYEIADEPKIAQMVLEVFGDGEIQLHENMPAILLKALTKIQAYLNSNSDYYAKMALAVLYFYNYKESGKEAADKNLQEMERTMQVLESAKEKFEPIPKDPNDECDIVSAYSNLRLNKFTEILKSLNKCVDIFDSLAVQTYEPQTIKNIPKLLANIGFEYRLHCFSIKSLQSFELSLKFANKIADHNAQLLALSLLIENSDVKESLVQEMLRQGDETAKILEKDNLGDKYSKTLSVYHISKAKAFLYDNTNLSFECWKIADALVTANETKNEFDFLRAELYILHYKLTKSCNFFPGEHARHPMTFKLHCAMDIVITSSHKNIMCSYDFCILFDTVYELAKVYYLMRLPRDLRAYTKNSVLLTQKIVLPLRCVSFLILLAHSDLLTCKLDHCNVKLNGVNDIFCLGQSRFIPDERMDFTEPGAKKIENEVDNCVSGIQEMALDLPQHTRQYSPSSPTLVVQSFKAPSFLSHEKTCMCFICLSFEYHQLLLQKYHLDALFNMYDKDEQVADEFIQGALMLYKTLMRNYDNYRERAKTLISESLIPNFDDRFREYYGSLLYDYSFHLMRKSQKPEALKVNTELVQLLNPKKFQYVYLYNDALLQRVSYLIPAPKEKSTKIEIETEMRSLRLEPKETISLQKTPTSNKSTVTVTINGIYNYSPPKRKVRRKRALFSSPSDTEDTLKKSPVHATTSKLIASKTSNSESNNNFTVPKTKDKKSAMPLLGTPLLGDAQTPKISIFTDAEPSGSVRKSRRKQPANNKKQFLLENPETKEIPLPTNTNKKSDRNISKILNSAMIDHEKIYNNNSKENEASNSQQPPIIAGPSKTRGQLLTQKIKASTLQSKTSSTTLKKNLVGGLLTEKVAIETIKDNVCSNAKEDEASSVVSVSPEHEIANTKSKAVLEKIRLSAKKSAKKVNKTVSKATNEQATRAELKINKNLLCDFLDNDASSSKCAKPTGPIRKSTRNRVL